MSKDIDRKILTALNEIDPDFQNVVYESDRRIFKAGMEAERAKLAAVPLDENMVHNCNKIIAKFLRDFDNEAHQYPIPILTQLLLSQLALYQNAKEIRAWKEGFDEGTERVCQILIHIKVFKSRKVFYDCLEEVSDGK